MKTILVPEKLEDPFLSAYEVVDGSTGICLGVASQYWDEQIRATTRSATWKKTRRWVGLIYGLHPRVRAFNSRKAAVAYITEGK